MTPFSLPRRRTRVVAALTLSLALTSLTVAQTRIVAPKNKYSVADDVKLGREASAQVKKELPLLNDERVDDYVETIGSRLAGAVPVNRVRSHTRQRTERASSSSRRRRRPPM